MRGKTALLFGVDSLVGNFVLQELLENHGFSKVRLFVKRPIEKKHPKVQQIIADYYNPDLLSHELEGEVLFYCLVSEDAEKDPSANKRFLYSDLPLSLGTVSRKNGVSHFIYLLPLSDKAFESPSHPLAGSSLLEKLQVKGPKNISLLKPQWGNRGKLSLGSRLWKFIPSFLLIGPLKRYRTVSPLVVAKAMVRIAEESKPKSVYESSELFSLVDS